MQCLSNNVAVKLSNVKYTISAIAELVNFPLVFFEIDCFNPSRSSTAINCIILSDCIHGETR